MPNWCDTTYKCVGDPKEVRSLFKVIQRNAKRKTPRVRNGFGIQCLGCIIDALGYDWEQYQCRGEISHAYLLDNVLTIHQNTAWSEQEGFRQVIEKAYPTIKVYYREEECGCEVYHTNDTTGQYFPERYFLDSYEDPMYYETIEEAAESISKRIDRKIEPTFDAITEALDDYMEEHEDDDEEVFFSFHEFSVEED